MASPRQQIVSIDKQIDANRDELCRRAGTRRFTPESRQVAWDNNPDLRQRENELFRQRGEAQRARDMADHQAFIHSKPRAPRAKKCPTCGAHTLFIARTSAERVA